MSRQWYYRSDRGVVGPQTLDQLRDRARAREVGCDTAVRDGPTGPWVPARSVLGPSAWGSAPDGSAGRPDEAPAPPQRGTPRRKGWLRRDDIGIGVLLVLLVCVAVPFFRTVWLDWRQEAERRAARRPEALILGRWEHVPKVGARQSVVFHTDGVVEYDGPTEGLEFERHVRYRFVDDRTVALLHTAESIRSLIDHFPEKREQLGTLRPGEEITRVTVSFPEPQKMVFNYVSGNQVTWMKAK